MKKTLSPPTVPVFLISLAIAILACLQATGNLNVVPLQPVWIMGAGYAVLALACILRGL